MTSTPHPAALDVQPARGLSNLGYVGFSLGMIGDRIFRDAPALLLLIFMTNYLAIPPALAGLAIFIPKIVIVFIDPLAGTISDRLKTPWGRRRPPMVVGAILASISLVLFFHVPTLKSPLAEATYMSALVLLGFIGFSLFSVPYLTMSTEVAHGDDERRKVMSYRVVFMALGLSLSAFSGGFVEFLGGGRRGYETMSWIYGAACLVTMLGTVLATGGVATDQALAPELSLFHQFRLVAANRRYLRLLLVGFAQKLGEGVGYASFGFFCLYVVKQPLSAIGLVVAASVAGQVLAQPLWLRASKRWSPPTLYTVGVLGWILNLALWLAMRGQSPLWLMPLGLQGGAAAGGFLMVTLAMLSKTLADDVARTGVNREGIYSGVWLASEKLAFALGTLVVGVVIGLFGFVSSANGASAPQTDTAVLGIAFTYCGLNAIIYAASILAVRWFAKIDGRPIAEIHH